MNDNVLNPGDGDSSHPSLEQLSAFAVGQLLEEAATRVEQHLAVCTACNQMLESCPNDAFVQLLQAGETLVRRGALPAVAPPRSLRFVPGYTLLEQLGQGAMGVVWKARQDGLDRVVALKRLRSTGAPSADALARFRREAEAVARLHHANIVQIHDVGEQDGEPYLALEYLAGGSLAEKLASGPLLPAAAATLVEALARAMQHAHEHGIIHRDLKPGNVLLDEDGSAKISDFGLAKQLDEATAATQSGAILGTPGYMAPEQAAGEKARVGPPADVYALGAILYETLTGRPPFQGPTVLDTLAQVREREPVPPRQLQPNIPRDLETICLKCLHKEPRLRYARAADLAEDLQRSLAGQPIRARRAGLVERLIKWARRKPAWAALGVVSTLALAALLGGGLWYQARLRLAVQQADSNRERADANYRLARQAINQMLDRLAKFQAPGVRQIEVLRRELSKDALAFFQDVARAGQDADPAARFDIAKASITLGKLLSEQGQLGTEGEILDYARLLLEGLAAEDTANLDYRLELSRCQEALAIYAGSRGRDEEHLRLREANVELCQELGRLAPDNVNCQSALALAHINLGNSYQMAGRLEQAERHFKESGRILEKIVREQPEFADDQYRSEIASANLAITYKELGRIDEADAVFREVGPRLTKLVKDNPAKKRWMDGLAQTLWNWGGMLVTARRGEEADLLINRAVAIMDNRDLEDPESPGVKQLLLVCILTHMYNSTLLHRRDEGDKDWQRALELSAQLKSWSELCSHAWMDADLGDHALAAARAAYLAKQKDLTSEDLFGLARAYAVAADGARKDSTLAPAERESKADGYVAEAGRLLDRAGSAELKGAPDVLYDCARVLALSGRADRAVALLSKLRSDGYFNTAENRKKLLAHSDLNSLRHRDDFLKLLNGLPRTSEPQGK